ncbi:MAG: hypothetical protein HW387_870 [Parachlamydiales bacterium]|nr:hypothetical protein [Parachlamydiales bacterium]
MTNPVPVITPNPGNPNLPISSQQNPETTSEKIIKVARTIFKVLGILILISSIVLCALYPGTIVALNLYAANLLPILQFVALAYIFGSHCIKNDSPEIGLKIGEITIK